MKNGSIGKYLIDGLKTVCLKMGEGNNAAIVSASIAGAKGVFRPIFTMSDKNSDPVTKKYTAIRECLTELIAIPVYLGSGALATFLSKKLNNPKFYMESAKKRLTEGATKEEILSKAKEVAQQKNHNIHVNLAFLGVALSALLIIPALCSATIKPLMGIIQKPDKNTPQNNITQLPKTNFVQAQNLYKNNYNRLNSFPHVNSSGMKVGSV